MMQMNLFIVMQIILLCGTIKFHQMLLCLLTGMTSAIMFCAFIVDLVVWYKADNINFGNDDALPPTQEEELTPITEKSCFETSKN